VDETEIAKLEPEHSARVVFRSEPERPYPGKVVRLGREADRETREFVVDVQVLQLPKNWAVGQRAEVFIETSRKDGVPLLPSSFVAWKGGTSGVFLAKEGRAAWQPMKTGLRNLEWVEIMEGLTTGQVAIVPAASHGILIEGRRVALP
jgi:multidrug efflux pump subunit AcrA (membrane-fusion protein)